MSIIKRSGSTFFNILILLLLIPFAFIFALIIPFDAIRYLFMPYRRNLKKKYRPFTAYRDTVKLYNRIVNEELGIEYKATEALEYFIKDDTVLIADYIGNDFEETDGRWGIRVSDEDTRPIENLIHEIKGLLFEEDSSLPLKFLIFKNDIGNSELFEKAKACPYFYCSDSVKNIN